MLDKPDLQDSAIIACVQDAYGAPVNQIAFLPLGADQNTAVYRIVATDEDEDGTPYFFKLRSGIFDETSVVLPRWLSDRGVAQIIPPLTTVDGQLWARLESYNAILYPFVEGRDGYEVGLSEGQWRELGAAIKAVHTADLPPELRKRIRRETYSPEGREMVMAFLERAEGEPFDDLLAAESAAFLAARRDAVLDLVGRAERLARELQARPLEFVLCHSDIHAANVLMTAAGALYVVDWDDPILAPKERDLMYVGGGLMGGYRSPREEEALFYPAYGPTSIDPVGLAYYRYERIVQDIAVFCERISSTSGSLRERELCFRYLASNFLPEGTIEIAYRSDTTSLHDGDV